MNMMFCYQIYDGHADLHSQRHVYKDVSGITQEILDGVEADICEGLPEQQSFIAFTGYFVADLAQFHQHNCEVAMQSMKLQSSAQQEVKGYANDLKVDIDARDSRIARELIYDPADFQRFAFEHALMRVVNERKRQKTKGFDTLHDDAHANKELSGAAESYLRTYLIGPSSNVLPPVMWPFEVAAWKPEEDNVENLVKGLALGLAELERIMRAELADGIDKVTKVTKAPNGKE